MNLKPKIISRKSIIIVLLFFKINAWGQEASSVVSCGKSLNLVFETENTFIKKTIAASKYWHLKYATSSEVLNERTKGYERIASGGELIAGANYRYKKTDNIEVYADNHDIITINNRDKSIMHTLSRPSDFNIADDANVKMLKDSLLRLMVIADCNPVMLDGRRFICYNLKSNKLSCPYRKAVIFVDSTTNAMYKMNIEMNLAYQKQVKSFIFTALEKNEVEKNIREEHVYDMFFSSSAKLKPPYNNFHLNDLTKNARQ